MIDGSVELDTLQIPFPSHGLGATCNLTGPLCDLLPKSLRSIKAKPYLGL